MDLSAKSVTELNAMTKAQIIAALTEDRRETKTTISTGDKRGQLREVRETRDLTGTLIGTQDITWTYYPAGNVKDITMIELDSKGKETSRQVIPHAEGGGLATEKIAAGMLEVG